MRKEIAGIVGILLITVLFTGVTGLNPNDPSDANQDPDKDQLKNFDEFRYGTDPNDPDTDGGGCWDGWEVFYRDRWYNYRGPDKISYELYGKRYLDLDDTQKQAVWDEFNKRGYDSFDPTSPIDDKNTDPTQPNPIYTDPDEDEWDNYREFLEGTDPTNPDTDNDTLIDSRDPNPLIPDTDKTSLPGGVGQGEGESDAQQQQGEQQQGQGQQQGEQQGQQQGGQQGEQQQGQGQQQGEQQGGQQGEQQGQQQGGQQGEQQQGQGQQQGESSGQGNQQQDQGQQQGGGEQQQQGQGQSQEQGSQQGEQQSGEQSGQQQQQGQGQGEQQSSGQGNQQQQSQQGDVGKKPATRIVVTYSDVWINKIHESGPKSITKGQPFLIKGYIEAQDPDSGNWGLIDAVMKVKIYANFSISVGYCERGSRYAPLVGSGDANLSADGNEGVGYFKIVCVIPGESPSGKGLIEIIAEENNYYQRGELIEDEKSTQGLPPSHDFSSKLILEPMKTFAMVDKF
ncbi:MAG: hypothetical protein AB1779_04805 [Candidatus Thermoplasmatota archaeon]